MTRTARRPAPVLSIDNTPHEPVYIAVGGTTYLLRRRSDLKIQHLMKLNRLQGAVESLQGKDDPTDAELTQLSDVVARLCEVIVDAPPAVLSSLSDADRLQIMHQHTLMTGVTVVARSAPVRKRPRRR